MVMNTYLGLVDIENIPADYDKYIWLSDRCLNSIDWCKKNNKDYQIIEDNWKTNIDLIENVDYLERVKKLIITYAGKILNDYHNTSFGYSEWYIMLSLWADDYLGVFYNKYLNLKKINHLDISFSKIVSFETESKVAVLDLYDFQDLLRRYGTDEYHLFLYSQLMDYIPIKNVESNEKRRYERHQVINPQIPKSSTSKWDKIYKFFKNLTKIQDDVVIQINYIPYDLQIAAMKKKIGKITGYQYCYERDLRPYLELKYDVEWRNKTDNFNSKKYDEFTLIMLKLLRKNLPVSYVENYKIIDKCADNWYRFAQNPKKIIYSTSEIMTGEVFKAYLMKQKKHGAIFCEVQHGGSFHDFSNMKIMDNFKIDDRFYTWGWREIPYKGCEFRPMPAIKMFRLNEVMERDRKRLTNRILFVGYVEAKYFSMMNINQLDGVERIEKTIKFIEALEPEVRKKLVIRPYSEDMGWNVKERLKEKFSDIRFDRYPDFYQSIMKSELIICEMGYTTFLEALYAGKAILLLDNPDRPIIKRNPSKEIQELIDVGIIVTDPLKMAETVNEISDNIFLWWMEPKRQKVVQKFIKNNVWFPQNAKKIWLKELTTNK